MAEVKVNTACPVCWEYERQMGMSKVEGGPARQRELLVAAQKTIADVIDLLEVGAESARLDAELGTTVRPSVMDTQAEKALAVAKAYLAR